MKFLQKFKWFSLGAFIAWVLFPVVVYAVNVTVPQATVQGQVPCGLTTGNYSNCNLIAGSNVTITTSTPGQITFSATGGSGGSSATTTIFSNATSTGPNFTFATGTETGLNLNITGSGSTVTFSPQLQSGYNIPLSASTTNWNNFYNTPSNRITAGTNLSWSANTLNGPSNATIEGLFSGTSPISYSSGAISCPTCVINSYASSTFASFSYGTSTYQTKLTNPITGTGTNGQVPYFTGSTALSSTANLLFNGTVFGFNATSSTIGFNIKGTAGTNDVFNVASSSNTSAFVVKSSGNVGINTSTPGSKLDVNGVGRGCMTHLATTSTATLTIDVSTCNMQETVLATNTVISLSNWLPNTAYQIILVQDGGSRTATFSSSTSPYISTLNTPTFGTATGTHNIASVMCLTVTCDAQISGASSYATTTP